MRHMFLRKLKLTNFRNYIDFEQEFSQLKTIIIGPNAQGKTNILEAINILATSVSERAERDSNLVFWEQEYALIFADIQTKDDKLDIALQINASGRRKLKINGVLKKAPQADLLGNFFCVMFSCEDLYLIKGSPSTRRSWLDSILFQLDVKYHRTLQDYQKVVTQKNALLKKSFELGMSRKVLKDQLDIWNEQIINFGSEIILKRHNFIHEIKQVAKEFQSNISKGNEDLDLIYENTIIRAALEANMTNLLDAIKASFKSALDVAFEQELARGQSVVGPHRDDINFLINGKEAKSFGSQGQQRSIVLSLKLSELKVIENRKNEVPVLLLDDVFAELDESRQDFLLHNLPLNIQTFLTTTHISDIQKELLENAQVIKIEKGKVVTN